MSKSKLFAFDLNGKKQKTLIGVVLIVCIVSIGYGKSINQRVQDVVGRCTTHHANYEVITYMQQAKNYNLLVADTGEKQEYGLMNVSSKADICGYDGMIFRYTSAQIYPFWNKDTLVNLDLTWRNDVSGYQSTVKLPSVLDQGVQTVSPRAPIDTVIEIIR
ncbi:MAG: DUF192 domain-containing protein [Candidatus Roizmanbacteria bacterium]